MAFGAVSVVNALATGRGAALSVSLRTKARVRLLKNSRKIEGRILGSNARENDQLIVNCVRRVFKYFRMKGLGARVETRSGIPIARGLKSSSAASNAVVLATAQAIGERLTPLRAVELAIDASLQSRVTRTGAYDDACASMLGGIAVTINPRRKLVRKYAIKGANKLRVLALVPSQKRYTGRIRLVRSTFLREMTSLAWDEARAGNWTAAMTLNGIAQGTAYSMSILPAIEAIRAGAVAAGLSGKGPATAAVVTLAKRGLVKRALRHHRGQVIEARINHQPAHVLS